MSVLQIFSIVFLGINVFMWMINLALAVVREKERLVTFCALSGWTVALLLAVQLYGG
jgi:hypothetical protein